MEFLYNEEGGFHAIPTQPLGCPVKSQVGLHYAFHHGQHFQWLSQAGSSQSQIPRVSNFLNPPIFLVQSNTI